MWNTASLLTILLMVMFLRLCHSTQEGVLHEDCTVQNDRSFSTPLNDSLLAYITPEQPLVVWFSFHNHGVEYYRDVVTMTTSEANHQEIRKDIISSSIKTFPTSIPKGWNIFRFTAGKTDFSLTWTTKEGLDITLLTLHFKITTEKISFKGNFAFCSEVSPVWDVSEGHSATVLMDLQSQHQEISVAGNGDAIAFVKYEKNESRDLHANTTLNVDITNNGSETTIKLFQDNTEELPIKQSPRSLPTIDMGCRQGRTLLRLKRSEPPPQSPPSPPVINSLLFIGIIALAVLLAVSLVGNVLAICFVGKAMTRQRNEPESYKDPEQPDHEGTRSHQPLPSECELRAQRKNPREDQPLV